MATVTLRAVTKRWKSGIALKEFDLDVADQEFLVLLGPSGCGKTTTMRIIAGLETATAGTVLIDGQDVTDRLARDRNIAMVFQNYALYPHMSVFSNIAYPLRVRGLSPSERNAKARAAAERVGLAGLLERKPQQLSGGQRQRVALARALVREPEVFLMDEPLSNLDAKLRIQMRAEIKRLHKELAVTIVYVTHDQVEAMTLADRVVIMEHGEVRQIGTPDQIYDDPDNLFVAGFLGSPPMNFIDGAIVGERFQAGGVDVPASAIAEQDDVALGFRAEDVELAGTDEGTLRGEVYAVEPTGDSTLIVVSLADTHITLRAGKSVRPQLDSTVGANISGSGLRFFSRRTGLRLRPGQ